MTQETQEFAAVITRLKRVEKQNRRLTRAGIATLLLVSASLVMAQTASVPEVIEAQAFVVSNADGTELARLSATGSELGTGPALVLYNAAGTIRTILSASEATSVLGLYGVDGKVRATMMVIARTSDLLMWSRDGEMLQVSMGADFDEGGYLDLFSATGNRLFGVP